MTMTNEAYGKMDDARVQIARLREQVDALMKDRVTPAVADFVGRAESAAQYANTTAREQAKMVSGRVKAKPLTAIMIAAAVGWVIGRAMR